MSGIRELTGPEAPSNPVAGYADDDFSDVSADSSDEFGWTEDETEAPIDTRRVQHPPLLLMMPPLREEETLMETSYRANSEVFRELGILDASATEIQKSWIRLLQIKPGTFGQPVHCKLIRRVLWDTGDYNALSYSWGKEPPSREIYMEGRDVSEIPFAVSTHLWTALQRLRDEQSVINVWIDAICINQQNYVERAAQVSIMAQIFNQADEVRVWLGEEYHPTRGSISDAKLLWLLCHRPCPWWKRLWVLQECAYAEKCPVIMLGAHMMSYEELLERWQSANPTPLELTEIPGLHNTLKTNLEFLRQPFDTWTAQKKTNRHRLSLLQRLRETAGRQYTDPHDRMYALLSLVDENESRNLRPDYRKPPWELSVEVENVLRQDPNWDKSRDGRVLLWLSLADSSDASRLYNEALTTAVISDNQDLVELLIDAGTDVKADISHALSTASARGHERVVRILIDAGADVKANNSRTLSRASVRGHEKVVRMLIDAGADVKADNSRTLSRASVRGHEKVVRMLIDAGADVRADNSYALSRASIRGHEKVVRMLIDAGADVRADNSYALSRASVRGHEKVVRMLIDAGADVKADNSNALLTALARGHTRVVRMLIDAGAVVKADNSRTPLTASD